MKNVYNDFQQIPKLTRSGNYQVNTQWKYLESWIQNMEQDLGLQLEPIFQRGHVWTREQQIAYVEFILRGGNTSKIIYFNYPSWHVNVKDGDYNDFVCVDGLQRLTAVRAFMRNEIPAFGTYYKDFKGHLPTDAELLLNVNDLRSEDEVLQWYIDLNSGGTPHDEDEIQRVKDMLAYRMYNASGLINQLEPGATVYVVGMYGKVHEAIVRKVNFNHDVLYSFTIELLNNTLGECAYAPSAIDDWVFFDKEQARQMSEKKDKEGIWNV